MMTSLEDLAYSSCLKHALLPSDGLLQLQTCLLTQYTDTSGPNTLTAIVSIIVQAERLVVVSCASCKAPMTAVCRYVQAHTHTFC